jgi:hypothetical protein
VTERRPLSPVSLLPACAVFALYAWNVRHYYFLGDDAFISFRYARHLVDGLGLVWNPGEAVEGYTNFLWVLLTAAGMALGIEPELLTPLLGIAAGAGVLLTVAWLTARTTGWGHPAAWLAPLVLAASRSFTAWSSGGLETQFFSLLVLLGFVAFVRERESASALLFAAASLTRPEGVLFAAVVGGFIGIDLLRKRRAPATAIRWSLIWLLPVASHLLWRKAYYGFWLPNTFHAKVNGLWLEQSLDYFALFHQDYRILWFLPLLALPALLRRELADRLFLVALVVYVAYVAAIGGDRFEFRFLVVIFPYLYWSIAEGIRWIGERQRVVALAAALALLALTHLGSIRPEAGTFRHDVEPIEATRDYGAMRVGQGKALRELIEAGTLPDDLVFCTGGVGAVPYYTGWPTVDYVGLNDVRIARQPLAERGAIAHEHRASREYLAERGVEVWDIFNGLLHSREQARQRVRYFAQRREQTQGGSRFVVIRLDPDRFLSFRSFASPSELERRFGHLEIVQNEP